jgi:aminoglycoside phosphotransferase (APT) family kinase protein
MEPEPNLPGTTGMEPERGYGWLGAVIPADARRFRVADPALAAALSDAGAELAELAPDVEIAPVGELQGDATVSIVVLGCPPSGDASLAVRAGRRLVNSVRVWLAARYIRRAVRRLGYSIVRVLAWDYHHTLQNHSTRTHAHWRRPLPEYLPQRALVIGQRAPDTRVLLDAVLDEAGRAVGAPLSAGAPSIRTGLLIADANQGMLRVAIGFGSRQIRSQRAALTALREVGASSFVAERVPWELAGGRCGIAEWSLERRLPGSRAKHPVEDHLLADCVKFLVALHSATTDRDHQSMLLQQGEIVARVAPPDCAPTVHALAERLERELADVPRGFAHGDFFHGNLLAEGGRLVGVVDWDAAGPGRLPLVDLLHLRHATHAVAELDWGPRLVQQLLPWARAGGDDIVRDYCQRLGFSVSHGRLEALVLAYWLDRVSSQLRSHAHRLAQPLWLDRNISLVLRIAG